jgi:uncharacterized membrane protein
MSSLAIDSSDERDSRPVVPDRSAINLDHVERWASILGGAAMALYGVRRRDWGGAVVALLGGALVHRGVSGHCPVYQALGVNTEHRRRGVLEKRHGPAAVLDASKAERVERTETIHRRADELYAYWRDFTNLPRVMAHLESVTIESETRSRWKVKAPAGQSVEWEAEIINEIPNELIAWKSVEEAVVPNAGSVHFTPLPRGGATEVRIVLEYQPPAGRLGAVVARLFGEEPGAQMRDDLRRFKQLMESSAVS